MNYTMKILPSCNDNRSFAFLLTPYIEAEGDMSLHHYKEYTRFNTIKEMDAAAEQHVITHWDEMTKSDRQVPDVIRRYSVKYGAAHLKQKRLGNPK